jgi:RNA polymerase sigma factor (sigma-70 family)
MAMAEDIASDTFMTAAQSWGLKGIPQNPAAWLYSVAKNKAINNLHRNAIFDNKIVPGLSGDTSVAPDIDLSPENIRDSQLQMMFAICHPSIPVEAQIGLSLKILCGFGIEEIADAFLSNTETISKRLYRAKEKLRVEKIEIALPPAPDIDARLETVLTTIYLLFNEGYYSISQDQTLRKDLCFEAIRLCHMLILNKATNTPRVNALLSLMCFHASRFGARINTAGELVSYDEQDTSLWNDEWIHKGAYFLHCATVGDTISAYHLQATIAWWNTQKADTPEKWDNILRLYNQLLQLEYSPIAALNRTYALAKANGKEEAIREAEKLKLTGNHFYFALLGELYSGIDNIKAAGNLHRAIALAKTETDRQTLTKKIEKLGKVIHSL